MAAKKTGAKGAAKKVTTKQPRESVKKTTTKSMTERTQDTESPAEDVAGDEQEPAG